MMQGQVSTWTEAQVEEKLSELCIEYRVVAILNDALTVKRKSIKLLSDDIANMFDHMKVPGTVIEKLGFSWDTCAAGAEGYFYYAVVEN